MWSLMASTALTLSFTLLATYTNPKPENLLLSVGLTIVCLFTILGTFLLHALTKRVNGGEASIPHKEDSSTEEIAKWKELVADLDKSTRMLIQRDRELTKANEKLQEIDVMKSDFVSLVTHQLRTPLSGIRWSLSMLLEGEMGELTPEQKTYIMKTYENNNRLITLINDMLQADRIDSGTLQFRFMPTNVNTLTENILTEVSPVAAKNNIHIRYEAGSDIPLLTIDPENMRIVLQNLIDNAVKYSKPNSEVFLSISKTKDGIEIIIQDHGIGIPKDHQANIFKRFFRAPNAVRTQTDGSGLGLYIVENIVKRHHGTISFTSEEGIGTTFFILLRTN